ncbi:uncharacterized protein LDX57_002981 [Aspergillus melleus]|uniref:uncharacterized protein n=1 Tax=Aspergillus melleus TaxID=138277 RepID=UPI001E8DD2FD|nr:uncharacterized protein LDX57_002981 [Aspergillus melleus]KAH8425223.1 hypothetical protein LDX57_002981 [Aspergillus melleus]
MAVINQDMMPPVPPMHHPPGHQAIHPTEVPRAFHPQHPHTPAPVNPAQLADEMARLRMNATNLAAANDQKARSFTPHKDFEVRVPAQYVGYTFFKADVPPGQKPTWSHAERTRMHLSQPDLIKMVQRKGKKLSSAQQYQTLKKLRRTHVDQLINEHRQSDPRFEWTCVYVNEDEKPFKGKNSRRGDYETVSMDVILMRKPVDTAHPNPKTLNIGVENSGLPFTAKDKPTTNVEELLARGEQQQASHDFMKSAHLARAGMQQGQTPGMVNQPAQQQQQQLHPQFQQQMPSQAQLNHPQGHPAGIRPQMNQVHQASLPRGMPAAVHQQPEFLNNSKSVPSKGPEIEILQQGMGGFPADMNTNMNTPRQAQGSNSAQNLFAQHLNQQRLSKENFARVNAAHGGLSGHGGIPHQGGIPQHGDIPRQGGLPHQGGLPRQGGVPGHGPIPAHAGIPNHGAVPNHAAIPRAPNVPEAEHEWGPENSSIGDDESIFLDEEDLSSITDGSSGEEDDGGVHEGDADLHGKAQPWRGSLFRRHSSKSRRQEPVYRTHYRKHSKTGVEGRNGRTKYPAGYIDVVPAESKNSTNRLSKVHTREVARPARDRPKIIHSASDNFDMVAYDEKYRGLRARNDIRTRILDDREARVERREKLVDYRTQMLDDRLDEARYLNRCMSMRESGGFYPRRYYLRDAL